jgi:hypothetical protein
MNLKIEKAVTILLISTMLFSPLLLLTPKAHAQATQIILEPSLIIVTENGHEFTVDCMVYDVTNLAGGDIQIAWDPYYLDYVSHLLTVPVETYPGGILHAPPLVVRDDVNATLGTYWWAASTLGGPAFTGDGMAFNMTFRTKNIPFGDPLDTFDTFINFTATDLADPAPAPIDHTTVDCTVRMYYQEFEYPEWPLLKVEPELIECDTVGENITVDVYLLGKNMTTGEHTDLSQFWDVSGVDAYLNFNVTHLNFIEGQNDPDGWFAGFWDGGIFEVTTPTEEVPGSIHFAFVGLPTPGHTAPFGQGRMLTLTFETLTESAEFPPGTSEICLENPQTFTGQYNFDSIGGPIDLANPVGTTFHQMSPFDGFCEGPFTVLSYVDDDGNGELSEDDHFILEDPSGFYFNYQLERIACTLNLTLAKSLDMSWPVTFPQSGLDNNGLPGRVRGSPPPSAYDGFGGTWYGNMTTTYPLLSVNSIEVVALPFTADEYTYFLTEGVDYLVHPDDDLIELLHPLDDVIINEYWVDGVNNTLSGWPWIGYVASGIESVYVKFPNGTERDSPNAGLYGDWTHGEWWFDPDWPWELEGWWCLGYGGYAGIWSWPDGSEWWINYTAAPMLRIDYNTDPSTVYVEMDGTYEDCLAVTDANGTTWNEVYPWPLNSYDCVFHDDADASTSITVGDYLWMSDLKQFLIEAVSTDLISNRKPWICNEDPADEFFGVAPIVGLPGYPHDENGDEIDDRDYCPWHNQAAYAVNLPHAVECATYVECFEPAGCFIDLYTQNGGRGPHNPSGMFWPQKNVHLCVEVTYGGWPEQNKDVAFEVIDPHGVTWGIWYGRTNAIGIACVDVRLPWPCDDPEYWFGEWCVIATVDCACVVINDTLCFKYDYRVHITDVELDKEEYKHCENIYITVHYLTRSMEEYNITFTVTAVDASGVPFGFDYITVTIGGAVYCSYVTDVVQLVVHVEKWARPPIGTLYVGALSDFPQNGGAAETPVYSEFFTILPEWAI